MIQTQNAAAPAISRQALFLILLTLLVYAQAITFSFLHLDDTVYIVENDAVHHWSDIPSYFTGKAGERFSAQTAPLLRNLYRPMVSCWILLNYKLFGNHAALWRLSAILMYVLSVWLFWRIAWRFSQDNFVALAASLIYALHPLHVEGVAWLAASCVEVLLSVFFLGGFLAYLRWRESRKSIWLLACAVLTLLAFLSKETAAALPVLIIAHALLFRSPENQSQARPIPLMRLSLIMVATAGLYALLRIAAIHAVVISYAQHNWADMLRTAPRLFVTQLQHALWPLHLAPWYDVPIVTAAGFANFYLPLAMCVAYLSLIVWSVGRKPLVALLLMWWAVTLLPAVAGSITLQDSGAVQDRFTFLGLAGLSMLAAMALRRLPALGHSLFGYDASVALSLAILTVVLGALSALQVNTWKNDFSMCLNAIAVSPKTLRPRALLGAEFMKHGDPQSAVAAYRGAVNIDPNQGGLLYPYAVALESAGNRAEAIQTLGRATQVSPKMAPAYFVLADLLMKEGRSDEATKVLEGGVRLNPEASILRWQLNQIRLSQQPGLR